MKEPKIDLIDVYLLAALLFVAGFAISPTSKDAGLASSNSNVDTMFNKWRRIW